MTSNEKRLVANSMSCEQAGKVLGVSHLAVSHKIRTGTLTGMMINGKWRVTKQAISCYLRAREKASSRRKEDASELSFKRQVREFRRLTPGQAAVILGVTRQRIEQLCKSKILKDYPCGVKLRMIDISSVVARLRGNQ